MKLNPYLNFDGTCEEAMETYAKVFGGELVAMMHFEDMPGEANFPPEMAKKVAHARIRIGESIIMASDMPAPFTPMAGSSVTLNIPEPDKAEATYNALLEGGTVIMPLEEMFWAYKFGMLVDRFGIRWMINCEKPKEAKS